MGRDFEVVRLMKVSPTQIETFDASTTWGCERKWWYQYIAKIRGPQDASMALGEAVHNTIEQFLKTGEKGYLHKIARPGVMMLEELRPRIVLVEHKIDVGELQLAGADVVGRLDALAMSEVIDWKTTSSIAKYAKTEGQLRDSVQMTIYAAWAKANTDLMVDEGARYTLGYFQTKGTPCAEKVSVQVSETKYENNLESIIATIERMVTVGKETDPAKVTPDESKCFLGFGCPHRAICPRSGAVSMGSLFASFGVTPAAPAPAAPSAAVVEGHAAVLPPDAPASDPALAALPPGSKKAAAPTTVTPTLPAPTPAPEPAKRGRPLGSKNRSPQPPLDIRPPDAAEAPEPKVEVKEVKPPARGEAVAPFKVTHISLRHGARVSLGKNSFSSVECELEMTAEVFGDPTAAREALSAFVKAGMAKELEVYTVKVPAVEAGSPGAK